MSVENKDTEAGEMRIYELFVPAKLNPQLPCP